MWQIGKMTEVFGPLVGLAVEREYKYTDTLCFEKMWAGSHSISVALVLYLQFNHYKNCKLDDEALRKL